MKIDVDFDHIVASGESAGGYMAIQSALTQPEGVIKALLIQYPMTIIHDKVDRKSVLGMPIPGPNLVKDHIVELKPGAIVSAAIPPARLDLSFAMTTYGFLDFLGHDKRLNPIEGLDSAKYFPSTWIIHGKDDEMVRVEDSLAFVEKLNRLFPETQVRLTIEKGNHGFDNEMTGEVEWLRKGLEWVEKGWLK